MTINLADRLRLQIGVPTGGLPNLLANPDRRMGAAGWVASSTNLTGVSGNFRVQASTAGPAGTNILTSEAYPVAAGQYVRGSIQTVGNEAATFFTFQVECLNSAGVVLATSASTGSLQHTTARTYTGTLLAPAGTTSSRTRIVLYGAGGFAPPAGGYLDFNLAQLAHATTSAALSGTYPYSEPYAWLDILGPTHSMDIDTEALNVGTLTAEILDADLDPAQADTVRPGKPIRLQAWSGGQWQDIFVGETAEGTTVYDKRKGGDLTEKGAVRVTVTATNATKRLANQSESRGVENISDLRSLLIGRGVAWMINDTSSWQGGAAPPVISRNDSASVLDQVAITRDSNLGYAWVCESNELHVNTAGVMRTDPYWTFTDQLTGLGEEYSYTDIDVSWSAATCINQVTVKFLRYDHTEQTTEEIAYGPYIDADSVAEHGAYAKEFTIQATTEDPIAIGIYAHSILAANSVPQVTANSLTINAQDDMGIYYATYTWLMDPVRVVYADRLDAVVRVHSVRHRITATADGGTWLTTYGFEPTGSVASPTVTPSPPANPNAVGLLSSRYRSTTQTISNNVETTVAFDAVVDADGIAYASGVWTVPKKGRYLVNATVSFAVNGTGTRQARLQKNGSGYVKIGSAGGTTQSHVSAEVSDTVKCNAGDTLRVLALQSSGGNLDIAGGTSKWTTASITYLGI